MRVDLSTKAIQKIKALIGADLIAVYHFGSTASGHGTADSDVDLAILSSGPISGKILYGLKHQLAVLLKKDVDIVDLKKADLVIVRQVLESGKLLHGKSAKAVAEFETTSLSRYCNFNEERRGIMQDIVKRGKIHAR